MTFKNNVFVMVHNFLGKIFGFGNDLKKKKAMLYNFPSHSTCMENILNIPNHQRNANQKHNKITTQQSEWLL